MSIKRALHGDNKRTKGAQTVSLFLCLAILLTTIQHGNAERKVVCYYTNWSIYRPGTAKFSPQNINPYLCTHLIYAFGGFTKDNALKPFDKYQDIEKGGYAKFTGLKTYNKNLKTLLAVGGWNEGSSRFSPMVADRERRREFVKNSIKFLRKNHFDGLDLDWEYPAFRDGGKPRDKDNYANLVQELREEFDRESSKTGRPRLLLSLAMPAGIEYIDKGYDVPRLNEYLDFINLLSYDYHSSYEPAVNHHAPLYPLEEDNEYNYDSELTIDYTIEYLLKKGASPEKIILGIPTYGRSYTLFNEDATDLGSPADGPGVEGDATREKGYLAYYEICESLAASDDWEVVQPNSNAMGPYAFKGDQWVGYDDENIVRLKAKYANEKHLGGIMFWTIDNDDFRGKCHDRPYPLIEAAKEVLLTDRLVFNKAADSCDYPRNVICPKSKTSQSTASTTRAPIVAATSRTTYLYSSTRKPTTEKPDSEEEYEEYDDDVDGIEEEEEEEEVKEEVKVPTTSKPLLYKTITRNKPTTTTTTTTEAPSSLSKSERHDLEKVIGSEGEEEDPKVIKELIMLIKKAGGIEELEKQLFLQNKSPDETNSENEPATPATISRTLYERVLSRQAGKSASRQRTSGSKSYANGPGGTQFEGLDEVPEVKTLRRSYKHQYVTIERPKSSTNEPPVEEEELNDEEDLDDDTADVASSEEQSIRNPFLTSSTQRATPNYINIRRGRPSTTAKSRYENDVDEKDEDIEEEVTAVRSRRPSISSKNTKSTSSEDTKDQESVPPLNDENSSTTKSRYISIQRFRSTTPRSPDVVSEVISTSQEPITETSVSSETLKAEEKTEAVVTTILSTTSTTTTPSSIILSTTINDIDRDLDKEEPISYASSTTESVKLVDDSATEILLTTAPASLSKVSSPSTRISTATVSQPRPFGFNRRTRPADAVTTPLPASNDQTRSKVSIASRNQTRSSILVGRGRLTSRQDADRVESRRDATEGSTRTPGRSRQRGSSRYTPSTVKTKTEESANSVIRSRARTTEAPSTLDSTSEPSRRRFRRPSARATVEHSKTNELDDSPIVRITQGYPKRNSPSRSRSAVTEEEETDKITNIRVFKKPTAVNRDVYARTRYTRKRNNVEELTKQTERVSSTSPYSSTTASTTTSAEPREIENPLNDPVTEEPYLNSVDEADSASTSSATTTEVPATTIQSDVETNVVESARTTEFNTENEVVTVIPENLLSANEKQTEPFSTTSKVEDFDPNIIRIVFPANATDLTAQGNRNVTVPKRKKVLLRKRPVTFSTVASQEEEEENRSVPRKRKVIRRLRPVRNDTTVSTVELSSTEEDQVVIRFGSTTSNADTTSFVTAAALDVEEDTVKSDVPIETASTAKTSNTMDYAFSDLAVTFEAPTTESFTADENSFDPDAVTMTSTLLDNFTAATTESETEESVTETNTAESTVSSFLINFTDKDSAYDISAPSSQPEALPTIVSQFATPLVTVQPSRRLEPYNKTYYLDSRYVRKKFVRRRPVDSAENVTSRYPVSGSFARPSSTTERNNEVASKRRKSLFVRRRPVSSTTTARTTQKDVNEKTLDDTMDLRLRLDEQFDSNDATPRINRANEEAVFAVDLPAKTVPEDFWSRYVTPATLISHGNPDPLTSPRLVAFNGTGGDETFSTGSEETYRSASINDRKAELRPRYRVPNSLRKTVSTEGSFALDSSPEEFEEGNDPTSRYQNFRQPRTRYLYRDGARNRDEGGEESLLDATQSPSFDSSTHVRSRFYARRPISTTAEPSVTETLIPAKKFDYVADAHRRQQSLRTTPRGPNEEDTTTLSGLGEERQEVQNLVDTDYTTTPPSKPLVTRLVTSVEESATTERQKILIKTKYSSLTSTTRIPLQTTVSWVPGTSDRSKDSTGETNEDESANEIRQGHVERSTLPIESEFLHRVPGWLTTESHESSTIEIESVFSNLIGSKDSGQ
ncbi:mucin-2-like [Hylaeus anthracinus]|uniref:mucin-2-like n=1 Tax=Hylaeus anthracinus TaxID=313031 RepID=UPI0023B8E481|nr:mucin-2-like [Hylaeus anthracinus]